MKNILKRSINKQPGTFTKEEILTAISAGIVGMGGATFPTQVKLYLLPEVLPRYLSSTVWNVSLTSALEHGKELIMGIELIMKALGVKRTIVGNRK